MAETSRRGLFYSRTYTCHFCGSQLEGYRMYPMARDRIERWDEYFDFPYYEATDASGQFSNFLLIEVKICPGCFFSSNDDNQFLTDKSTDESWRPDNNEKNAVNGQAEARGQIAGSAANLQGFPRDAGDALIAYKLAMHSATILFTASRKNPLEAVRLGNYALKCAFLSEKTGQPERVNLWRKAAMEYFSKAFGLDIKGVTLYRTVYQLGALSIFFTEDRGASKAFDFLRQLYDREPSRDLSRYLERLRKIWTDRDLYRMKA